MKESLILKHEYLSECPTNIKLRGLSEGKHE